MSLRQIVIVIVGLAFVLSSAWGINLYSRLGRLNNWLTLEQINERVSTDLTVGTPLSEIDKYFSDNAVEHSYVARTNEVFAMIHSIWGGKFLIQKDAWIKIALDENQNLKDIKVEPVFTGP
jgi:hypothetical protein